MPRISASRGSGGFQLAFSLKAAGVSIAGATYGVFGPHAAVTAIITSNHDGTRTRRGPCDSFVRVFASSWLAFFPYVVLIAARCWRRPGRHARSAHPSANRAG